MCYKSKFLIGFYLAVLFMSASFPVQAMEEEGQNAKQKQKGSHKKRILGKKTRSLTNLNLVHHKRPAPPPKMPQPTPARPQQAEKLKSEIKYLNSQEEHKAFLKGAVMNAEQEVRISSNEVSRKFLKEEFFPSLKKAKNKFPVIIYMPPENKETFREAEASSEQKSDYNHPIKLRTLPSCYTNELLVDQNSYAAGAYPWLFSLESQEERIYHTTVILGENAKEQIKKCRQDLIRAGNRNLRARRESSKLSRLIKLGGIVEPKDSTPTKFSELSLGASEIRAGLEKEKAIAAAGASGATNTGLKTDTNDEVPTDCNDLSCIIGESDSEEETSSSDGGSNSDSSNESHQLKLKPSEAEKTVLYDDPDDEDLSLRSQYYRDMLKNRAPLTPKNPEK
ncbi:MAG: hypothetical protein BGO67_06135 [Alphaproteobacteria bacterium 41-28]|nr:MAG: hypothetical protein BGO67_06135 [Alphaproteobacteria bacterium 41-28]